MKKMTEIHKKEPIDMDENRQNLLDKCALQEQQIEELSTKLKWYEEQFRLAQQKRFGTSSEKTDPEQLSMFDEAEQEADSKAVEPTVEEITYKRRKTKGKKDKMFEDLHEMSKEVRKKLKVIPAQPLR